MKKTWYLYTTEFYSATKKYEILSFTGKWKLARLRRAKATVLPDL
jgi:hypothetical protein